MRLLFLTLSYGVGHESAAEKDTAKKAHAQMTENRVGNATWESKAGSDVI